MFFSRKSDPDFFIATYALPKSGTPIWNMPRVRICPYNLKSISGDSSSDSIASRITRKQLFAGTEESLPESEIYPNFTPAQWVRLISGEYSSEFSMYGFKATSRSLELSFYQLMNPHHRLIVTLGQNYRELEFDFHFDMPSYRIQAPNHHWRVEQASYLRVLLTRIRIEPSTPLEQLVYRPYVNYQADIVERFYNLATGKPDGGSLRYELSDCQYDSPLANFTRIFGHHK